MLKMRPYVPSNRVAIRDSIDDDLSDDVEDEVFIKDARSSKLSEENGLKRPLMAPRRKNGRLHSTSPIMKKHYNRRCWRWAEPFCYGCAALVTLVGLISVAALILTMFPVPLHKIKVWWQPTGPGVNVTTGNVTASLPLEKDQGVRYGSSLGSEFVPCTQIRVQKLWSRSFPRMNSESPVRKADLNGDDIEDIVFGFGVDDNIQYEGVALPKCKSTQGDGVMLPCEGGVVAVNGATGELMWQTWSVANVFSLVCSLDIDKDGYPDCVAAGRLGMIFAINGRNGQMIWEYTEVEVETNSPVVMDLYTINVVRDLNGDQTPEILAAHLEEREQSRAGHLKVISAKTGTVIRTIPTPFKEEVFVPLQVLTRADGSEVLMIVTGGQNTPGGVYSIRLLTLMEYTSEKEFTPLFRLKDSGVMVPPVLTDVTGDGVPDVIVSSFKSVVYAFDGRNYTQLWNYTFPNSESVSAVVPGHFNHDNVSDFMIKYNMGPGFPVYYYSQTTILDGRTGKPLLDSMMMDSGGSSSLLGGMSVSQTFGGDFFLHWQLQCRDKYDVREAYEFIPESDIILQSRADTCRLRYNASTVVKLYAIARHIEPPGAVLFSSDDLEVHLNETLHQLPANRQHSSKSPLKHPKMLKKLLANREQLLRKAVAEATAGKAEKPAKLVPSSSGGSKGNLLRNQFLEQELLPQLLQNNDQLEQAVNSYEPPVKTGYMGAEGSLFGGNNQFRDYEAARLPEEYDVAYPDNEVAQAVAENERPIRLRTKYPGNRDIRSDVTLFEDEGNVTESLPTGGVPQNSLDKQEPLSLWDLEMEKEERDAIKEAHKYDASSAGAAIQGDDQNLLANKRRRRRRRSSSNTTEKNPASESSRAVEPTVTVTTAAVDPVEEWFLPSISSTGVLLKSLNGTRSSLDFAFVLNIRESETFPPLYLKQDNDCVQEKFSAYKSFTSDNYRSLQKQLLRECLKERQVHMTPSYPKYESQLVITRIGITCTCRTLQPGEVCSELEDIKTQRWTEFMGNDGNGYYAN